MTRDTVLVLIIRLFSDYNFFRVKSIIYCENRGVGVYGAESGACYADGSVASSPASPLFSLFSVLYLTRLHVSDFHSSEIRRFSLLHTREPHSALVHILYIYYINAGRRREKMCEACER